ncbi:hypothetical protein INT44_008988 [Umbelopsis vinacea]|uniref:Uncharacterized protein n=1 Tax=Umbelopsis vinacea TaxID=44442 RepID=A0A8H7Q147_9FUNG|nr:hypothetical protein INT44_008988 [Umbelopsis vinacea]
MVSSFGSEYHKEGSLRANSYGHHIISGSSFDTSSFGSNNQASAGMTAELLEDMSIIDDLYNEYGDTSEPDEIGKEKPMIIELEGFLVCPALLTRASWAFISQRI